MHVDLHHNQTKIDGILRGDHEPTLDLIAAILLLVDNEPFSPVKEATTSHDSQLRQRWMLLGYAIRCACRLGLHEVRDPYLQFMPASIAADPDQPRLLASEPDTYRDRAALLWSCKAQSIPSADCQQIASCLKHISTCLYRVPYQPGERFPRFAPPSNRRVQVQHQTHFDHCRLLVIPPTWPRSYSTIVNVSRNT